MLGLQEFKEGLVIQFYYNREKFKNKVTQLLIDTCSIFQSFFKT